MRTFPCGQFVQFLICESGSYNVYSRSLLLYDEYSMQSLHFQTFYRRQTGLLDSDDQYILRNWRPNWSGNRHFISRNGNENYWLYLFLSHYTLLLSSLSLNSRISHIKTFKGKNIWVEKTPISLHLSTLLLLYCIIGWLRWMDTNLCLQSWGGWWKRIKCIGFNILDYKRYCSINLTLLVGASRK